MWKARAIFRLTNQFDKVCAFCLEEFCSFNDFGIFGPDTRQDSSKLVKFYSVILFEKLDNEIEKWVKIIRPDSCPSWWREKGSTAREIFISRISLVKLSAKWSWQKKIREFFISTSGIQSVECDIWVTWCGSARDQGLVEFTGRLVRDTHLRRQPFT